VDPGGAINIGGTQPIYNCPGQGEAEIGITLIGNDIYWDDEYHNNELVGGITCANDVYHMTISEGSNTLVWEKVNSSVVVGAIEDCHAAHCFE